MIVDGGHKHPKKRANSKCLTLVQGMVTGGYIHVGYNFGLIFDKLLLYCHPFTIEDLGELVTESKTSNLRYQRKADLMGAPIDDELVLLHVDKGQYYSLKGAGPDLWARLENPASLDDLVDWICGEHEVAREVALADIEGFLSELQEIEAIDVAEAG